LPTSVSWLVPLDVEVLETPVADHRDARLLLLEGVDEHPAAGKVAHERTASSVKVFFRPHGLVHPQADRLEHFLRLGGALVGNADAQIDRFLLHVERQHVLADLDRLRALVRDALEGAFLEGQEGADRSPTPSPGRGRIASYST
jgi:hypothetical protein